MERRMLLDWTMTASLINTGAVFPIHGTIESCIEAWRKLPANAKKSATLLSEFPIKTNDMAAPSASFHGEALEALSAMLEGSAKAPPRKR
jgi:hypothetical protein